MAKNLAALIAGCIFGAGLTLSGMTDPHKVLGFLTLAPGWDPALVFVMGAAVVTATIGFTLVGRLDRPVLGMSFQWPGKTDVTGRLVVGSAIFGLGWGIGGFCPGPALVAALTFDPRGVVFLPAFVVGMLLFELLPGDSPGVGTPQTDTR